MAVTGPNPPFRADGASGSRRAAVEARDLLGLVSLDDPRLSPDGTQVVFLRTRIVASEDRYLTELVVADVDPGSESVVLAEMTGITRPRWSADGARIAFIAPHPAGARGLWVVRTRGSAPLALSDPGGPVLDFAWHPDGSRLVAVVRLPAPGDRVAPPEGVIRTNRLRWKEDGVGLLGDRWRNLVSVSVAGDPTEDVVPILRGRFDVEAPTFSSDGTMAFLGDLEGGEGRATSVYLLEPRAGASSKPGAKRLTSFADVRIAELDWSPDGTHLAIAGHDRASVGHYAAQRLWIVETATGAKRALTEHDDGSIGNAAYSDTGGYGGSTGPKWTSDGRALLAPISSGGRVRLFRFGLDGTCEALTPPDQVASGFDHACDRVVWLAHGVGGPAHIETLDLASRPLARVQIRVEPAFTAPAVEPLPLRVPPRAGDDSPALDAWILLPGATRGHGTAEAASVPLVVYMGGGPGGMRSDNFMFEFQLFAHAGYAVLWANARGCQGYGDPFCTAVLGSWGGADFDDAIRALDHALATLPELDGDRVAVAGGSYGGYLVNWAIGHSDRFRAAVSDRSVSNRLSAFGTSDIGFLRTFEYEDGTPWEKPEAYLRQSPLNGLAGARTPTLVIHSALDHRCPIEQGEQVFAALKVQGVPTELLRFPNESHGLSRGGRPWHRIKRLEAYVEWFDRWLR